MTLKERIAQATMLNPFYPGYGGCFRCTRNWRICESHTTMYSSDSGTFPLCEECWQELSIEERLVYYRLLWNQQNAFASGEVKRVDIHTGELRTLHLPTQEDEVERLYLIEEAVRKGL